MSASRPEHEVLITIARREMGSAEVDKLRRLLRLNLDWEYLLASARQHGLIPLFHNNTAKVAVNLLPSHIRTRLKQESVENSQSVLYLADKAVKLSKLLRDNGIENALFKGPILSELVYGEIGLRQAGDIDVLIKKEHFSRAKALLESLGYVMQPQLTPAQEASHLAFHCEIQFMRDDWFTVVDLHWGLTPRSFVFGLSGDEVMTRLQTVSLAGSQVETFSREDLLLYQAMHGAKHLWRKLEWISSLTELVHSLESSSWPVILERTTRAHATRILGLGLRLVDTLFGVAAPQDVLIALDEDRAMQEFAEKLSGELFLARSGRTDSTDTNLYNLKIMDRKRDALLSTLRAIFIPTLSDWEALSLPAPLHSLYYAVRPLRLSKVYSSSLFHKVTDRPTN